MTDSSSRPVRSDMQCHKWRRERWGVKSRVGGGEGGNWQLEVGGEGAREAELGVQVLEGS